MTDATMPLPADALQREARSIQPRPRFDKQIWGIYIALIFISLVELYSASSREIVSGNILTPLLRHGMLLFVGFLIMLGLQRVHYRVFYKYTFLIVAVCILATLYTMFFGQVINGARRSFSFFGLFSVQPSELLKLSIALFIARMLSGYRVHYRPGKAEEDKRHNIRLIAWVLGMTGLFCLMLIKQGFTNTFVLYVIAIIMMLIGGVRWRVWLAIVGVSILVGGFYTGVKIMGARHDAESQTEQIDREDRSGTRKARILDFLREGKYTEKITSEHQQEQYSFIAQANGGVFGRFPGNSEMTSTLPLAFSDYIYAIIIEDLGLVGGILVMFLYIWLLARAGRIASKCTKAFPALLVLGMAVFIVCQALVHMAIVTGAMPVSGQPLPLISKGGSSVIITSVALGMMLSVSRYAERKGPRQEMHDNLTPLADADMTPNPTLI